ncbi:MAG: DUF4159 domain-containing protein [Planctomycetota bacterium]
MTHLRSAVSKLCPVPRCGAACLFVIVGAILVLTPLSAAAGDADDPGRVYAAKLVYANHKTSVCFSEQFLTEVAEQTHIDTHRELVPVQSGSAELFNYPFAVMTGEGAFTLTDAQVDNLRTYLTHGGFVIASAGCSSKDWNHSMAAALKRMFPDRSDGLTALTADHPIFHSVYDITSSRYKTGGSKLPELRGLELDGRVVLVWSPDGLNDTANAGGGCCCCGGNEIQSAKQLNVNILAYALTH